MKNKKQKHIAALALTSPLLLDKKHTKNPYRFIEQFFSATSLGACRAEIDSCYRCALNEGVKHKNISNLLFAHHQLVHLLDAGYLIVSNKITYQPNPIHNGEVFSEWSNSASYGKERNCLAHYQYSSPYWLKIKYRECPINYLKKTLKIETIAYIRKGLQEWQYAAVSQYSSIEGIGAEYSFKLYKLLHRLVEAFYLLLMANAEIKQDVI